MLDTNRVSNQSIKKIAPITATAFVAAMLVGAFSFPTTAFAVVNFDPDCDQPVTNSSGECGFVGKGEVQTAFGWNNAQLQKNAKDVTFTAESTAKYDVTCEWDTVTGQGKIIHHDVTVPKNLKVSSAIAYDSRTNTKGSITGFLLTGVSVSGGDVPQEGQACPGNSDQGLITDVQLISESPLTLYVNYNDQKVALGEF